MEANAALQPLHLTAVVVSKHWTSSGVYESTEKVSEDGKAIGQDTSRCVPASNHQTRCTGQYTLTHGTIDFGGTIPSGTNTNRLKIARGSGRYKQAQGTVLTEYNRAGTKAHETISFTG
jgi:hypothetical protein